MQECKGLRGGACFVISLEHLQRLYKRKSNDQETRDGRAQVWLSRRNLAPGESDLHPVFCLCDIPPSSLCPLPAPDSTSCRNPPAEASSSPWTHLLKMLNNANVMRNINCNPNEQMVVFYNDNILTKCSSDAFDFGDSSPVGVMGRCNNNNVIEANNKDQQDQSERFLIHKEQSDRHVYHDRQTMEEKSGGVRRKSVSFADDVIVYLFDKDSPTEEPRHTSSSSLYSDNLLDDNGLEWEDDFLALERNRQPHVRPKPRRSPTSAPPTLNWTVNTPRSLVLSPSCLFLTHVSESDLEL